MIYSDEEIIEQAFAYFREHGFPYRKLPVHVCMQEINKLAALPDDKLATSVLGYQIADTYHIERFSTPVNGMKTPKEAFYDDKVLKRCLTRMLTKGTGIKETLIGGVGGIAITSGTQAAANFRPAYALKMYRKYCQAGYKVLDTSAGFGGRAVGAMAFPDLYYVGIDPSTKSHVGNEIMVRDLGFSDRIKFIHSPVEDLLDMPCFSDWTNQEYDFAFTSPPYFSKELYENYWLEGRAVQSWSRYPTGEEWKTGFLDKMMLYQYSCLKHGSYSVVNIADVTIRNKIYNLVDWCKDSAARAGFIFEGTDTLNLQKRIGSGHEDAPVATESVLIFKKD
jgi:hypothetical protein